MIVGGSSLGDEETKLRRQVGARLPPAASGATADIDEAVRTAVELRALPARIWLTRLLRAWLPIHIVSTAVVLTLLALHILLALGLSWT
jgi:alpha-D-ribose 1-methylphosphonate 5-triphosphate synthase subunit PhnH